MEYYAGLDVSLELTSVCIVDAQGAIICEAKVLSEPETLLGFLRGLRLQFGRIGLEAGPLSQWLHAGLIAAGFEAVAPGDTACEGGTVGDDGEDRPARCSRYCAAPSAGMV